MRLNGVSVTTVESKSHDAHYSNISELLAPLCKYLVLESKLDIWGHASYADVFLE